MNSFGRFIFLVDFRSGRDRDQGDGGRGGPGGPQAASGAAHGRAPVAAVTGGAHCEPGDGVWDGPGLPADAGRGGAGEGGAPGGARGAGLCPPDLGALHLYREREAVLPRQQGG